MTVVLNISGEDPFKELNDKLDKLTKEVKKMALSQADFDTELADLVSSVAALIAAVEAIPPADLTAEGQSVSDAAAAVKAELDKLNPTPPAA